MPQNLKQLERDIANTSTIGNLSSIFEIISTIKINETKNSVFASQKFFIDLWSLYRDLLKAQKTDELPSRNASINKTICLVVTSSDSFSGPADDEIIRLLDSDPDTAGSDIAIIGRKGVSILTSKGRSIILGFDSPDTTKPIDVTPLSNLIVKYKKAYCIYQTFISLVNQKITKTNLKPYENIDNIKSNIDLADYIIEPSYDEIMQYLELVILNISLTQIIFESRLSEYANRFKTTTVINDRAKEAIKLMNLQYNQTKRRMKDEALRQQLFQGGRR
jgi:ATP synthase F1 gamma subunit